MCILHSPLQRSYLNIGGFKFVTSEQTLSKEPYSLLNHITTDIERKHFIDRPAKHFNTILNYIRNDSFLFIITTIPDEMLTFDTEPEETIDHFQKENLEDKISEIRKQNETKITLNIGGFKFVTSKQTLSNKPYSY